MTDPTREELAALIARLDAAAGLRLRLALVRQAASYAGHLLGERDRAEHACLAAVQRWLDRPDDPATIQAISAQLEHERRLEERDEGPVREVWDAARATRAELPEAARLAVEVAGEVGYQSVVASGVDGMRGRRVAQERARAAARSWQLDAAQAILAGAEPPPLPALPQPSDDPAEILAAARRQIDPRSAYERGDLSELRLLMSPEQAQEFARRELALAMSCAASMLPPSEEDRGERASLRPGPIAWLELSRLQADNIFRQIATARASAQGQAQLQTKLLPLAVAALLRARTRRRQISMARAVAVGLPLPTEPDKTMLLAGRMAAYRAGDLAELCAGLDAAGRLRFKQAMLEQALWYAIQLLPGPAADRGHLATVEAIDSWLRDPQADPPADAMEPLPADAPPADALVWKAMRGLTEAARAHDAPMLLWAIDTVVRHATAAKTQTAADGVAAKMTVERSRDYQLAAAYRIGAGLQPPPWLGPEPVYSPETFDATLRRMGEAQHGLLRLGLIRDACAEVRRGLEADLRSEARQPGGWQLVKALEAWTAAPDAAILGAALAPSESLEAARRAAAAESGQPSEPLALALQAAALLSSLPERLPFATRAVAGYCEQAVVLAGHAIGGRCLLDAAYSLLAGAEPPPLAVLTSF